MGGRPIASTLHACLPLPPPVHDEWTFFAPTALERSSDTLLKFALREVERVLSDQSRTNRETINRLWDVLDDPHLNRALGIPQNSRTFRRSRF
jgi:hypothetical protein